MMTTDLATRETDSWTSVLEPARVLATDIAATEFVPAAMRGNPHKVLAAVLTGRELGLGPMQSLASIDVIEGKASLQAKAMLALIRAAGHQVRISESGNLRCVMKGRRKEDRDDPEAWETFSYTYEEARQAGITVGFNKKTGKVGPKKNWESFRQDMLAARTITRMARLMFPDVIMGLETKEVLLDGDETTEVVDGVSETVEVQAPATLVTVRKTPVKQPAKRQTVKTQAPKPDLALSDITGDTSTETLASVDEILDVEVINDITDSVEMITPAQLKKLHTVLSEAGMGDVASRDEAIQFYRDATRDDTITSSKDLTKAQAMTVINALEKVANPPAVPPGDFDGPAFPQTP